MSALSRFEQFMESLVEDSVARLFRSPVQPAEIAKRLERAMESHQTISVRRVIVPNIYRVFLNPRDFMAFQPIRKEVEREMANYLNELANERQFTMLEHPRVEMSEDSAVPRRTIQVVAETVERGSEGATQVMTATAQLQSSSQQNQRALLLLETTNGPHPIPLESTLLNIGRGLNNDIILEDTRVSRHHAQLRYKTRRFWITDLGSTNGTFINGERISEAALGDQDVISLGGLELLFREG
ncbi:MAG: DUF3662 domain-containing protein [Chloroflexaceae bacterium]|nr:DUF3662 domain-containing protein [Chloroflexaceae bacterium]